MHKIAVRFAASTLVIAMTMIGCRSDVAMSRPTSASARVARADADAARFFEEARRQVARGELAAALRPAERAVEMSPRDAGYRLLLADLYVKNGRFRSAEATFGDVIALDPSNVRAGLGRALSQIAQGRSSDALVELERLEGTASGSDLGLAYALAGQTQRAIDLLEPAARAPGATGRTRQNLALAYAFAGDWQRARTIAAQDVAPDELAGRLRQWAGFAQQSSPAAQVASLLGVTPAEDPGQPVRLALAPPQPEAPVFAEAPEQPAAPAAPVYAEAAPAPAAVVDAPAPAPTPAAIPVMAAAAPPVAFAAVEPQSVQIPVNAPEAAPAPAPSPEELRFAMAARSLVQPQAAVVRASVPVARAPRPAFERSSPRRAAVQRASAPIPAASSGNFVVQLGAFSNAGNAERAWIQAERRFGLASAAPVTTTVNVGGKTLHRVSIAGFASRSDAVRLCGSIQSQGGTCFVRATAGDSAVRWASRHGRNRRA